MLPTYTLSNLRTKINDKVHGQVDSTTMNSIINNSVREVTETTDLRTAKRTAMLSLDGRNLVANEAVEGVYGSTMRSNIKSEADKYNFYCPADLKGDAIIDIRERYDKLLQFAYRRVIRVFETDENAVPLFYRADYMLCLLGNVTEGIAKVPEEIAAKIKQAYFAMKERHNCTRSLPCEEDLDRWL